MFIKGHPRRDNFRNQLINAAHDSKIIKPMDINQISNISNNCFIPLQYYVAHPSFHSSDTILFLVYLPPTHLSQSENFDFRRITDGSAFIKFPEHSTTSTTFPVTAAAGLCLQRERDRREEKNQNVNKKK